MFKYDLDLRCFAWGALTCACLFGFSDKSVKTLAILWNVDIGSPVKASAIGCAFSSKVVFTSDSVAVLTEDISGK